MHRSQWLTHADRFVLIGSCAESGDDDGDNDGAIVTNYRAVVAWTGVLRFRSTEYPVHQDNNNNHNQNHKNNIDDSGGDHHTEKYRSNPIFRLVSQRDTNRRFKDVPLAQPLQRQQTHRHPHNPRVLHRVLGMTMSVMCWCWAAVPPVGPCRLCWQQETTTVV